MRKFFSGTRLRGLTALLFFVAAVLGLVWHSGWGTASSFGIADIAAVCPLGALETMVASKTFLPRALAALVVFLVAAWLFGRFFCGWLCPVPWTGKLARLLRRGAHAVKRPRADEKADDLSGAESDARSACAACSASSGFCVAASTSGAHTGASSCRDCPSAERFVREATRAGESAAEARSTAADGEKAPYYVLGGALASSAVFGFPVFCLICPVGLTFALVIALWRLFEFNETNWAILWFAGFLILELFVLRRWCGKFCPLGALMTLAARLNRTFRPHADRVLCTRAAHGSDCTVCRDVCPEGLDPATMRETDFSSARCTKCGACAAACPTGAIHFPWRSSDENKRVIPIAPVERTEGAASAVSTNASSRIAAENLSEAEALSHCVHCGRCGEACPLGERMVHATALLSRGRREDAAEVLLAPGGFPEISSRVCPVERLCEGACAAEHLETSGDAGRHVPIAMLERTVVDDALKDGWTPQPRRTLKSCRVAVVGAGPAGLACADVLARAGVEVHVIDKAPAAGGLMTFGIPSFKLPRAIVQHRISLLEKSGVRFACGLEAGVDLAWSDLAKEFDAVFIGTGASVPVSLGLEDSAADAPQKPGILYADSFLRAAANRELGLDAKSAAAEALSLEDFAGKRVAVLGGGDTALDCARTAIRLGASAVFCVARRKRTALRARAVDLAAAEREGVHILCEREAVEVLRHGDESLAGLRLLDTSMAGGAAASEVLAAVDCVIVAYGFRVRKDSKLEALGVRYDDATGRTTMVVDGEGRTGAARIWAGGDAVRGPSLVSYALADGLHAGRAIARELGVSSDG